MKPHHTNILKKLTSHFGAAPSLLWDPSEEGPEVGCAYFPAEKTGRPWGTLATYGMSLQPMVLDERAEDTDTKRTELIAYVREDETKLDDLANWMCWAGAFPFLQDPPTYLGWGHTIHMGEVFENSSLTTLLTLTTIVIADTGTVFRVDDDDVSFLWLTFLTDAEYALAKEHGVNAILDLFLEYKHPVTLDRSRTSYV
ncbi:suppressor of fused domain protein [Longitalea luteola]|uniref:suppressor of fused domain protein n=1 Tax=Longitalea luteola TaxID=2812563 RepID=UPI001A95CA81|nr:suppressor of fused domain protein [Longitalea luteola]